MAPTIPVECSVHGSSLREDMKQSTLGLHGVADKLLEGVLLHKRMSVHCYKKYVSALYFLYEALETELQRHAENPALNPIHFPELFRFGTLREDLEYFYGADWRSEVQCSEAMELYVEHIHKIANSQPELLAAHAYVRYFGDLSGGQILKKVISRTYKLPKDGSGVAFYDFSHLANIKEFKALFTSRLEQMGLSVDVREKVVQEARLVFQFNISLLRELDDLVEREKTAEKRLLFTTRVASRAGLWRTALYGVGVAALTCIAVYPYWRGAPL